MRRVVITGRGTVSRLGNDLLTVRDALVHGRSGICALPQYAQLGLRSQVAGIPQIDLDAYIDRKDRRFMGDAAAYSYVAMKQAIAESGLDGAVVSHLRTGLSVGSGGGSFANQIEAARQIIATAGLISGLAAVQISLN